MARSIAGGVRGRVLRRARGARLAAAWLLVAVVASAQAEPASTGRPFWTTLASDHGELAGIPLPTRTAADDGSVLPTVRWTGHVVGEHGEPLAGARVRVVPNGHALLDLGVRPEPYWEFVGLGREGTRRLDDVPWPRLPHTTTDASGRFTLDVPHVPMDKEVGETKFGLPEPVLVLESAGHATLTERLSWQGAAVSDLGTRALQVEARARGRLVDAHGRPVAGARVRPDYLLWRDGRIDALADALQGTDSASDGTFLLTNLTADTWRFVAEAPGLQPRSIEIETESGRTAEVEDVILDEGRQLTGRVVDPSGRGLPGVRVFATHDPTTHSGHGCIIRAIEAGLHDGLPLQVRAHARPGSITGITGDGGAFALHGLPPGSRLTVYAFGHGLEPTELRDVRPGSRGVVLRVRPDTTLTLRVLDETTGLPIAGARPRAWRLPGLPGEREPLVIEPGEHVGEHVVRGVGHLEQRIRVVAPGYDAAWAEVPRLDDRAPGPVVVRLPPTSRVPVHVRDDRGQPLADVWVEVVRQRPRDHARHVALARSDARGRVEVPRIPDTRIAFRRPGHAEVRVASDFAEPPLDVEVPRLASLAVSLFTSQGNRYLPALDDRFYLSRARHSGRVVRRSVYRLERVGDTWSLRDVPPGDYTIELPYGEARLTLRPGEHHEFAFRNDGSALGR